MKFYFPEAQEQIDYVGYNNAIKMFGSVLKKYLTNDPEEADYRIYCNIPWHHNIKELKVNNLPLMVYTMYESTKVPKSWIKWLNKHADVVLLPSPWCIKIFKDCGLKKPVYLLRLGFDHEKIGYTPKTKNLAEYTYMWQGVALDLGGRKGVDYAIKAFKELRKEKRIGTDTKLILKFMPYRDSEFTLDYVTDKNNILYVQKNLSRTALKDMYSTVDCCINPTHGEGFGLIPVEQMAMGKPTIVTGWSISYLNEFCYKTKYKLKKSCVGWNHKHLRISKCEISINLGGLCKNIRFMPKHFPKVPDGKNYKKLTKKGIVDVKLPFFKKVKAKLNNWFSNFQEKTGFMYSKTAKGITIFNENPGQDAYCDIDSLKNQMEYCYKNSTKTFDTGFMCSNFVFDKWNKNIMKDDFLYICKCILKKQGVC